jgi:hypothetical protein
MFSPSAFVKFGTACALGVVSTAVAQNVQADELPFLAIILRAQQSYRLEHKAFALSIGQLAIRPADLKNYRYTIIKSDAKQMIAKSIPLKPGHKSYAAGAFFIQKDDFSQILCQSDGLSNSIASPYLQKGVWSCGQYSHIISRTP